MKDTETLVEMTENTEETVEETTAEEKGRFITDEELEKLINEKANSITDRRVARAMKKYEREMAKYKDTENVLKSQIGGENIDEVNKNLRDLYAKDGIELPAEYQYQDERDIERLGLGDAEDIISGGKEFMIQEAERLANIGYKNLDKREQIVFMELVKKLNSMKDEEELLSIGASKDLLSDKDFINYRNKFKDDVPIKDIYDSYSLKQTEQLNPVGSLENGTSENSKNTYSDEEINRLTLEDLDDDDTWIKVRNSMTNSKN